MNYVRFDDVCTRIQERDEVKKPGTLSRREREVMDILHRRGESTAAEVRAAMTKPPTDPAVRSILRILVEKSQVGFEQQGPRYVYSPTVPREAARRSALDHVLQTFFDGSTEGALAALLEIRNDRLTDAERRSLKRLIDRAAREGR